MITLSNINISHVLYPRIDLAGIRLGVGGGGREQTSPIPGLEGVLGLYSGKGLTNEQMSANPVWKDKSGLGNDLQMKNFLWNLGSGCGNYKENYRGSRWIKSAVRADLTWTDHSINITSVKINSAIVYYQAYSEQPSFTVPSYTVRISGLENGQTIRYRQVTSEGYFYYDIKENGIYILPSFIFIGNLDWYGFILSKVQESCNITIEQIPDYSGAIVFDGVDDYGICETFPILTKEKGYTVMALRKWLSRPNKALGLVSNVKDWFKNGAFIVEYNNTNDSKNYYNAPISFGRINISNTLPDLITYQTSIEYNGESITAGNFLSTDTLMVGTASNYANVALYSLVIIDHDTTEEERQLAIDYWKKEFPELLTNPQKQII